jgi:hypothetical protein
VSALSPYQGTPAADLEVANIKLGMTPEQVFAALKAYDGGFFFSKRYYTSAGSWSDTQSQECATNAEIQVFGVLTAAKASTFLAGARKRKVDTTTFLVTGKEESNFDSADLAGCGADAKLLPGDQPEVVNVYFSPDPGSHKVVAVTLWKYLKPQLLVDAVVNQVLKKYPSETTDKRTFEGPSPRMRWVWLFDGRGRLRSLEAAGRLSLHSLENPSNCCVTETRFAPWFGQPIMPSGGVDLEVSVLPDRGNAQVARAYQISLYDTRELSRLSLKLKSVVDTIANDKLRQQTESARRASGTSSGRAATGKAAIVEPSPLPADWGDRLLRYPSVDYLYLLSYALWGQEPPIAELVKLDPAVKGANEFNRDSAERKAEADLRARASEVAGTRFLEVVVRGSLGTYDGRRKEFNFAIADGGSFRLGTGFDNFVDLVIWNGDDSSSWPMEPDVAEGIVRRNQGSREVDLHLKLELELAPMRVSDYTFTKGRPLIEVNGRILAYEIRTTQGALLGKVVVGEPSKGTFPEAPSVAEVSTAGRPSESRDASLPTTQQGPVIPQLDQAGVFYVLSATGSLVPLEHRGCGRDTRSRPGGKTEYLFYVQGSRSPVRFPAGTDVRPVVRPQAGEVLYLKFESKKDGRSLTVTFAGDSPIIKPGADAYPVKFDSAEIGGGTRRLHTPAKLGPGEYCLLFNTARDAYCFGVDPAGN